MTGLFFADYLDASNHCEHSLVKLLLSHWLDQNGVCQDNRSPIVANNGTIQKECPYYFGPVSRLVENLEPLHEGFPKQPTNLLSWHKPSIINQSTKIFFQSTHTFAVGFLVILAVQSEIHS